MAVMQINMDDDAYEKLQAFLTATNGDAEDWVHHIVQGTVERLPDIRGLSRNDADHQLSRYYPDKNKIESFRELAEVIGDITEVYVSIDVLLGIGLTTDQIEGVGIKIPEWKMEELIACKRICELVHNQLQSPTTAETDFTIPLAQLKENGYQSWMEEVLLDELGDMDEVANVKISRDKLRIEAHCHKQECQSL